MHFFEFFLRQRYLNQQQRFAVVQGFELLHHLLAPNYGISVAGVYRVTEQGIKSIPGSGGVSPLDASMGVREDEAKCASHGADVWG